jgi:polar amino acid transport system substrate-binding protein
MRAQAAWAVICGIVSIARLAPAADPLRVAISEDIPPYVTEQATSGAEVELLRRALADHALRFVQLPYGALQTAVARGRADVSVGVQRIGDGVYSARDVIGFENYAVSRTADALTLDAIADLAPHRVLAWQGAWRELGPDFAKLFGPDGPAHARYVEVADQAEQVRRFWAEAGTVAVIDGTIFRWFSKQLGHAPGDAALHALFPPVTEFAVGFGSPDVRDRFDRGLTALCTSGDYAAILRRWDVLLKRSVCDEPTR